MRRDLTGEITKLIDKRTQSTKRISKRTTVKKIETNTALYFDPADQKLLLNKLKDASVATAALQNLAVDTSKLADLSVEAAKLASSSVTATKIANAAVGSAAIANLAVGNAHIQSLAVLEGNIGNLAVTNGKIANLAVNDAKISSVAATKVTTGTLSTEYWDGDGSNDYQLLYRQVHQFIENNSLVKMAMGFVDDENGTKVPGIVLGAGTGDQTGANKGFITKDASGLNLFYVNTSNVAHGISIQADGIHVTDDLILDNTLAQSYVTQSGWMSNLTQKLNSSGNFGVNQSGKRIEITDMLVGKNSSNQYMGLYINPTYSDMILYYNGSEHFKLYNQLNGYTSMYVQTNRIGYGNSSKFVADGDWDFSGLDGSYRVAYVNATAPSSPAINDLWVQI